MSRYEWMADARCAQVDPDLWTADRPGNTYRDARLVRQRCPVKRECDAHAERLRAQPDIALHGMWAEQTPRRRDDRHDQMGEAA